MHFTQVWTELNEHWLKLNDAALNQNLDLSYIW